MINIRDICSAEQAAEIEDLADDYLDFCKLLKEQGNNEIVPLHVFAKWRNEEFEAREDFTNPIPSIN